MTFIEKYIREKLGRADAPPELDANDLWAGIESQLPPEDEVPPKVVFFAWKGMVLGLLLLMAAGGAWFFYATPSQEVTLAEATPAATAATDSPTSAAQTDAATTTTQKGGDYPTGTPANRSNPTPVKAPQRSIVQHGENTPDDNAVKIALPKATLNKISPASSGKAQNQLSTTSQKTTLPNTALPTTSAPADDDFVIVYSPIEAESPVVEKPVVAPAAAPPSEVLGNTGTAPNTEDSPTTNPEFTEGAIPITEAEVVTEAATETAEEQVSSPVLNEPSETSALNENDEKEGPSFKGRNGSRLSIGLHTGTNLLLRSYATGSEGPGEALNTAVKTAAGTSFGFDLNYRITDRLSVSTGLEYHRTLNPFDYESIKDTVIDHPSEFNSGLIRAVARRRVTHNHRLSFFTVPIQLNHTWTFGDFGIGLGAGVGLNFRQSATGKTLDANGAVVAYDAASGTADVPDFFLSYRLRPVLSWQPKPDGKLRFEFAGNLSYQTFGVSPLSGLKQSGLLFGGTLGLRYGF